MQSEWNEQRCADGAADDEDDDYGEGEDAFDFCDTGCTESQVTTDEPSNDPAPAIAAMGFSSADEKRESGSPYLRNDLLPEASQGELRSVRFHREFTPDAEARVWLVRNQEQFKSFAAYKTPSGDVVLLYASKCASRILA